MGEPADFTASLFEIREFHATRIQAQISKSIWLICQHGEKNWIRYRFFFLANASQEANSKGTNATGTSKIGKGKEVFLGGRDLFSLQ